MNKYLYNFYAKDMLGFFTDHVIIPDNKLAKTNKIELFGWKQKILYSDYILIKKVRNAGITELIAAEIAYNLNFQKNFNMIYICPDIQMAMDAKKMVDWHFNNIPSDIRVPLQKNKNEYLYETLINNKVIFLTDIGVKRGYSYNAIYMEEVDSIKNFENICDFILFGMKSPGKIKITRTPLNSNLYFDAKWNNSSNIFDKLELIYQNNEIVVKNKKTLNDISIEEFSEIVTECVIP